MKHFSLLIILSVCLSQSHAQSFTYATRAGFTNNEYSNAMVGDASGNVFITGKFRDSIKFGTLSTLITNGYDDIFIVKYSSSGVAQWSKKFGSTTGYDQGTGIRLDASGNIYMCGQFGGTIAFDSYSLTSSGGDIFVVKLNSSGVAQWASKAGSTMSDDNPTGIDIDGNSNVYVTGVFSGVASFGNGVTLTSTIHPLYQTYSVDLFIAKFNSTGVCQWANKGSSYQTDYSFGIATDQGGNSYITGYVGQTADFSGSTITYQGGGVDIVIAGYNSGGTLILLKSSPPVNGYAEYEAGYGIELDPSEQNFYVTGLFSGYLVFGDDTVHSNGDYDMFIVKFNKSTGNEVWMRDTYSTQWEDGQRIAIDSIGNVYVGFHDYHSGTPPFPEVTFTSAGYYDPVVVKYTNKGQFVWANRGGSVSYDYVRGLALGTGGKVWLTGLIGNTATFGPYTLSNYGADDFYLVQLQSDLVTGALSGASYCAGLSISVPFTANITYNSGNTFTAQLSDTSGLFGNPVAIGTLNGTTSGTINGTIPANTAEGLHYRVRVIASDSSRNGGDNGSDLAIHGVPSITITANGNTTICNGSSVLLSGVGNGSTIFQWYKNANTIAGATGTTYSATQTGDYNCVITNSYNCSFTSNTIHVTVNGNPTATINAGGPTTFCAGGSVTLTSNTNNNFSYQWRKNGTNVSGATASAYTATVTADFSIVITNQYGCSTVSNIIAVTKNPKPTATITAAGPVTFCDGSSVILNANTGSGLTYKWKKDNAVLSGGTNASYTATLSGVYKTTVSNQYGCTKISNTITVTVNPSPTSTITPSGPTSFCQGDSVILNANTGSGLTYKWKKNGSNISGATKASYTAKVAATYKVVVTNQSACSKTSAGTIVTVPCKEQALTGAIPFTIFPNPNSGTFEISSPEDLTGSRLEIINLLGQKVFENRHIAENTVDVSFLPGSSYFVRVITKEGSHTVSLEVIR
ncbi:MAG TPA: SBBP repeat-containing protein [Chitinophagales bacterium]|nr:SBBP repeat-containing protein [Chitinophagales bacterium]